MSNFFHFPAEFSEFTYALIVAVNPENGEHQLGVIPLNSLPSTALQFGEPQTRPKGKSSGKHHPTKVTVCKAVCGELRVAVFRKKDGDTFVTSVVLRQDCVIIYSDFANGTGQGHDTTALSEFTQVATQLDTGLSDQVLRQIRFIDPDTVL